jgi:hypothetical protein
MGQTFPLANTVVVVVVVQTQQGKLRSLVEQVAQAKNL